MGLDYEQLFEERSGLIKAETRTYFTSLKEKHPEYTDKHLEKTLLDWTIRKQKDLYSIVLVEEANSYSVPNYYIETVCQNFYKEYTGSPSISRYKSNKVTQFIENDLPEIQKDIRSRLNNSGTDPYREAIRNSLLTIMNEHLITLMAEYCMYQDHLNERLETGKPPILEGTGTSDPVPIQWTGSKVDLVKIVYAAFHNKQINNGTGSITQVCEKVLELFDVDFKEDDNALSSSISKARKNGHNQYKFLDNLQVGFRNYLSKLPSMKGENFE